MIVMARSLKVAVGVALAMVSFACSSTTSSPAVAMLDGGGGGSCSGLKESSTVTWTAVTKDSTSASGCPDQTVAELNKADTSDAGDDGCKPKIDATNCKVSVSCTDKDGTKTDGSFSVTATAVSGSMTVVASGLTCKYTLVGSIK